MHYAHPYLLNPTHPITVALVGCGGTGSQVLTCLARMDFVLRGLGHPGFYVQAYDPDVVTESNFGRQLFSPSEIEYNKAAALITRVNRFFGLAWEANGIPYCRHTVETIDPTNIVISCVDTVEARKELSDIWSNGNASGHEYDDGFYWMDFGNTQKTGQAVLGTWNEIKQPSGQPQKLPTVLELFYDEFERATEEDQGPSCSLAEALSRQDLFINSTLAMLGMDILWKLIRETRIEYHGVFLNLETMKVNPIPI